MIVVWGYFTTLILKFCYNNYLSIYNKQCDVGFHNEKEWGALQVVCIKQITLNVNINS